MELLTWTSEISWCTEHIGPLNMYKHITHWAARPCPRPVSPTHDSSRPTQIEEPLPWADSRAWKRPRRSGGSLYSAPEPPAGEPCDEPVCPAAFTVVWLTLGLLVVVVVVGRHWPPRAAVGGNSCSDECIPLTGQRPFYNLISRSITLIFFFFFPFCFSSVVLRSFTKVPKWQQTLCHVQNRGRSSSRFCLFRCHVPGPVRPLVQRTYASRCVSVARL